MLMHWRRRPGWRLFLLLWCVTLLPSWVLAEPVTLKFATLAPEGTPWMNLMEEMNGELRRRSNNQVAFRFYAGGVAGDERDVLRKIRINQLHGGAFSGFGLGELVPEIRVLELPLLFRNAPEADHVASALFPRFTEALAHKGYILLGLNEAGPVHIFSQHAMHTRTDLGRTKMWTWQGDPVPLALFKSYGITPVPLTLPDVLPALQSGLIDTFYGPPLAILALQWFTKARYVSARPITYVMGALVLSKQQWQHLLPEHQTLVREIVTTYHAKIATTMRQHHQKALSLLHTLGLQSVTMSETEMEHLGQVSDGVRNGLVGKLYSQELLEQALQLRDQYRQTNKQ
jgi:TRAP-type C4-dicarboxylate transport system substrate-binding protein